MSLQPRKILAMLPSGRIVGYFETTADGFLEMKIRVNKDDKIFPMVRKVLTKFDETGDIEFLD